jgi:hypothetical protein
MGPASSGAIFHCCTGFALRSCASNGSGHPAGRPRCGRLRRHSGRRLSARTGRNGYLDRTQYSRASPTCPALSWADARSGAVAGIAQVVGCLDVRCRPAGAPRRPTGPTAPAAPLVSSLFCSGAAGRIRPVTTRASLPGWSPLGFTARPTGAWRPQADTRSAMTGGFVSGMPSPKP